MLGSAARPRSAQVLEAAEGGWLPVGMRAHRMQGTLLVSPQQDEEAEPSPAISWHRYTNTNPFGCFFFL